METLDFDVEVSAAADGSYDVEARSVAGEVRASSRFPFDELALQNRLQALQIALLVSERGQRADTSEGGRTVQDFAGSLFEFLFGGEVRSAYEVCREKAHDRGADLRIRLRCDVPELATLPWEFVFDQRRGTYLSLSRRTQVVRYLEIPEPIAPLQIKSPLRILGVLSSPDDLPPLDLDRERDRLDQALASLQRDGLVVLEWLREPTWRALQQALRHEWHVFHFSGHGGFDRNKGLGRLAFVDETQAAGSRASSRWLTAEEVGALLGDSDSLRLAVLNACEGATSDAQDIFSSTAAMLVRKGTPAVIAMQFAISDRAAVELTRTFYESLAEGLAVDIALAEARKAVYLGVSGTFEWGTPVLYLRAPTGVLFEIEDTPATAVPLSRDIEAEASPILDVSEELIDTGASAPVEAPAAVRAEPTRAAHATSPPSPPSQSEPRRREDPSDGRGLITKTERRSHRKAWMVGGLAALIIALAVGVGALLMSNGDDNGAVGAAAPVSREGGNGGDEAGTFNLSDVTGLSLSDATSRLEDAGLHAVAEPQVSSRVELGRVIGTVPAAATKVVPGEGVFILVSSNAVPDVTNMTQDAAAAALEKNGFEVQASPEASSAVAAGRVIRTDPAAGTPVLPGGAVELIVASGQRPTGRPEVSGSPSARN